MSLIHDLTDLYATEAGVTHIEGTWESTSTALTPRAAAKKTNAEDFGPPIEYTMQGASGGTWGGASVTSQLELSTAESTLFSVLELISKKTSSAKWKGVRKTRTRRPDAEPVEVMPEQNLAVQLWDKPNPFMTGKYVRQIGTWHLRAVGQAWFVVDYYDAGMSLPRAWWPVRPDRMAPKLDPAEFISGYTYTSPDGQKIDLDKREVLRMVNPHPLNVWEGMGVVQTLMRTVGTSLTTEQWIAAFFANDATPGGYIEYEDELEEPEYQRLRRRWNEQHRGVSKAHRIGLIEMGGKYTQAAYSMKELQFPEIRRLSRDQILEAFRVHPHNMGISAEVNKANAFAALDQLAQNELEPNLEDWSELSGQFRLLFGAAGEVVELVYDSPRPEDREEERADRTAKVNDYVALVDAGVDPVAAQEFLGLPELPLVQVAPEASPDLPEQRGSVDPVTGELDETKKGDPSAVAVTAQKLYLAVKDNALLTREEGRQILVDAGADIDPAAWPEDEEPAPVLPVPPGDTPAGPGDDGGVSSTDAGGPAEDASNLPVASARPRTIRAAAADVDLSTMDEQWNEILAALLLAWPGVLVGQYDSLQQQVRDAVNDNDLNALLAISTPDSGAADTLALAMVQAAMVGANAVVREADEQDVQIGARVPEREELEEQAGVITTLMRASLAVAAAQAAMRVLAPGASGEDVAEQVRTHLDSLTDAQPKQHLGGALTMAQNAGRFETLAVAPEAMYFASEQLDQATCTPCRRVDGKRYETLDESKEDYPTSGYRKCEGLERCRGTVVAVWVEREEGDGE